MSKENGGPAFPRDHAFDGHNGMTLRDYFAAKALNGIIADTGVNLPDRDDDFAFDAKLAYAYADAMLAERSKP